MILNVLLRNLATASRNEEILTEDKTNNFKPPRQENFCLSVRRQ